MKLTINEAIDVIKDVNVEAAKVSAKQEIGGLINDRLIGYVTPKLPMMIRGYADTAIGKAVMANLFAITAVKYFGGNEKVAMAAEAAVYAATQDLVREIDLRGMVNDLLDGIDLSELKDKVTNKEA